MMPDAPNYVNLNSGVMIHSQSPQSLPLDQAFPASLEVQFLADEGKSPRPTANMCSPGTHIEMGGKLITQHIVRSTAPTFPAGEWVKIEVEGHGHDEIIYRVNGTEVLRYQHPQLDPKDPWAAAAIQAGSARLISFGAHCAPGRGPAGLVPQHRAEVAGGAVTRARPVLSGWIWAFGPVLLQSVSNQPVQRPGSTKNLVICAIAVLSGRGEPPTFAPP